MKTKSLVLLVGAAALVAVMLAGWARCAQRATEKVTEKAVEKQREREGGGKAAVDLGSDVDLSALPEVLHYPGAKAVGRFAMTQATGSGGQYLLQTTDSVAAVGRHDEDALVSWKLMAEMEHQEGRRPTFESPDGVQTATITNGRDQAKSLTQIGVLHVKNQG